MRRNSILKYHCAPCNTLDSYILPPRHVMIHSILHTARTYLRARSVVSSNDQWRRWQGKKLSTDPRRRRRGLFWHSTGGVGSTRKKEREKEKERAERGIFISIRFFLVISYNASLFSLLPSPPDGKRERAYARAYHYREGIIGWS